MPGIVFSQAQQGLAYARTDIGGMYRWNPATSSWIPLLDWLSWDNGNYAGVASVAADPVNANKVWAAVGMYTNDWDPNNGAILRSADKGDTWQISTLPFKIGGNMPGRGMGERLAVDPNNDNVLYLGAPSGKGLWRSTDGGVTWAQVTSFPNPGTYVQKPGDAAYGDNQGIVWVTFDKGTGSAGTTTKTIYVGVADKNNPVYRSTDGGANWFQGTEPSGVNTSGTIAAAADGSRFVWAPGDSGQQVVYSVGFGTSWTASTDVPANAIVASDRVNPMKFYAFSSGKFYVSTNGGASFTATTASGLPTTNWGLRFKAVLGHEGDIWLAGGSDNAKGLWHSTDSGATFTKVSTVDEADNIGFGKAAPGQTYPALYAFAKVDGQRGIFRSDDAAGSWVRINDDQHQWGSSQDAITGDPAVYGRVYFSAGGRGIMYGDRVSTTPPSVSTSTSRTSATPSASQSSPSPTPLQFFTYSPVVTRWPMFSRPRS